MKWIVLFGAGNLVKITASLVNAVGLEVDILVNAALKLTTLPTFSQSDASCIRLDGTKVGVPLVYVNLLYYEVVLGSGSKKMEVKNGQTI